MTAEPDCIFCGIVAGESPSTTVARTERALAFMDINPVTPGHALVTPRYEDDPSKDRIGAPWQTVTSTPDEIEQIGRLLS